MSTARRPVAPTGLLDLELNDHPTVTPPQIAQARGAVSVLRHVVTYRYARRVDRVRQRLIVVPRRTHDDQQRVEYRFRVLVDDDREPTTLHTGTDDFGNTVISVNAHEIETQVIFETRAVITRLRSGRRTAHAHPQTLLQPTRLTAPSPAITALAETVSADGPAADRGISLMHGLRTLMSYGKGVTTVKTTAAEALSAGAGVCQDLAHVLISTCRQAGIPARYVSGHLVGEGASHAWVEVIDPRTREVTVLDPTHDREADLRYVTVAVGRDYSDVSPTLGSVWSDHGGGGKLSIDKQFRVVTVT